MEEGCCCMTKVWRRLSIRKRNKQQHDRAKNDEGVKMKL